MAMLRGASYEVERRVAKCKHAIASTSNRCSRRGLLVKRHIEVYGRPLCDWRASLPIVQYMKLTSTPSGRKVAECSCSNDDPDQSESDAADLRALGLNAVSLEGGCPGFDRITDVCEGCP